MIVVLDYGMGNLRSVERALAWLGASARVQSNLQGATKLIIPGVGAFAAAMERIEPLRGEIRAIAESGAPLLGICLGQQLLMEWSEESPNGALLRHPGLGLIGGGVRYLPQSPGLKIPHMGWSPVSFRADSRLGHGADDKSHLYFVHSLYTDCEDPADVAATTDFGIRFPSAIERGNLWGTQFHPEKSGDTGLNLLRNFVSC